jgi:hypothetical protein
MEGGREEGMIRLVGWIGGARAEEHARAWPACGRGGERRGAARPVCPVLRRDGVPLLLSLFSRRGAEDVCDPRFSGRFLVTDRTSPSPCPCLPACLPAFSRSPRPWCRGAAPAAAAAGAQGNAAPLVLATLFLLATDIFYRCRRPGGGAGG